MSNALQNFIFRGETLDISEQPENIKNMLRDLHNTEVALGEKKNLLSVLNKAKNAYVNDLKLELLTEKSGFNFLDD